MIEIYKLQADNDEFECISIDEVGSFVEQKSLFKPSEKGFIWIDIAGYENLNEEEAKLLNDILKVHPLVVEDCIEKKHYPKIEEYDNYLFCIVSKMLQHESEELESTKLSFILGKNYILTYRHLEMKEVSSVKKMLKSGSDEFKSPVDILYLITDKIIDDYVGIIEGFTTRIYEIEETIFDTPNDPKILRNISFIRKNLIILRRNALMQKQVFNELVTGNIVGLGLSKRKAYFKDICDHIDKVLSRVDNQKEYITGVLNIQLGLSTQKLNGLIKFLTTVSAALLPATLIASIFGMNFNKMPFVDLDFGFVIVISIMAILGGSILFLFYNKKWLE